MLKYLPLFLISANLLSAHPDHAEETALSVAQTAPKLGDVTMAVVGDFLYIQSRAMPSHETGKFPNRANPNRITAQSFSFRIPLEPGRSERPVSYHGYEFGVAINGVPFDPGTGESWQGNRQWREEAILDGKTSQLGIDQNNAHVQPTGKYHYHGVPWGLIEELREDNPKAGVDQPLLIGWAADGYPIYYQDSIRSSWRLKSGERATPPDGPGGEIDGLYTADYEYVNDSGDLDWLNGRYGVTDEYPEGIYQYYVTENFPYVPRYFLGVPDETFSKRKDGHANNAGPNGVNRRGASGSAQSLRSPLPPTNN